MPQTITGRFSCDNAFSIWTGTATTVQTSIMPVTVANGGAIALGQTLPPVTVTEDDFLYIIAFSDDSNLQGLIGSFTGILTIPLDDPRCGDGSERTKCAPARGSRHASPFRRTRTASSEVAAL